MRHHVQLTLLVAVGVALLVGWVRLLENTVKTDRANYRRECAVRFASARTVADSVRIMDAPQGPRRIHCGAFLEAR